jgi:hypothetical protein
MVEFASNTRTWMPARARVMAAANPLGPEPTTMASRFASFISRQIACKMKARLLRSIHLPPNE